MTPEFNQDTPLLVAVAQYTTGQDIITAITQLVAGESSIQAKAVADGKLGLAQQHGHAAFVLNQLLFNLHGQVLARAAQAEKQGKARPVMDNTDTADGMRIG